MKRLLLYGGLTAAILGTSWWLGHRAGQQSKAPLGSLGFSGLDYALAMPKLNAKAASQIAKATAGSWLTSYTQAEDLSSFWPASTYDVQAFYAGAYWMAVAARVLRSRSLAADAYAYAMQGAARYIIPGSSLLTGSISSILKVAAAKIKAKAGDNKNVQGILKALGEHARPEVIAAEQANAEDRNWVQKGAAKSAEDVAALPGKALDAIAGPLAFIRSFFGMLDPKTNLPYSGWLRWGSRALLLGVAGIAARWYFAPQYHAAKAAIKGLGAAKAPKQITTAAVADKVAA